MKNKLSRVTVTTFLALASIGFVYGIYLYLHRPSTFPPNKSANNAILVHIILALVTVIAVVTIQIWRNRRQLSNIWLALFSQQAFERLKHTVRPQQKSVLSILRALVCIVPLYLILWNPFRSAMQILAAFDPSVTANAWGGPTYLGASLAHWLDGAVLMYIGAFLLDRIMVKK